MTHWFEHTFLKFFLWVHPFLSLKLPFSFIWIMHMLRRFEGFCSNFRDAIGGEVFWFGFDLSHLIPFYWFFGWCFFFNIIINRLSSEYYWQLQYLRIRWGSKLYFMEFSTSVHFFLILQITGDWIFISILL